MVYKLSKRYSALRTSLRNWSLMMHLAGLLPQKPWWNRLMYHDSDWVTGDKRFILFDKGRWFVWLKELIVRVLASSLGLNYIIPGVIFRCMQYPWDSPTIFNCCEFSNWTYSANAVRFLYIYIRWPWCILLYTLKTWLRWHAPLFMPKSITPFKSRDCG